MKRKYERKPRVSRRTDMQRRLVGSVFLISIVIALAAFLVPQSGKRQTEVPSGDPDFFLPKTGIRGDEVPTIADASNLVGYEVKAPRSELSGLSLQSVRVSTDDRLVILVFGTNPISPDSLLSLRLVADGYWILEIAPEVVSVAPAEIVKSVVSEMGGRAQSVEIGGQPGFIVCPGDVCNHLVWWSDGLKYDLITPIQASSSQMIAAATSIA